MIITANISNNFILCKATKKIDLLQDPGQYGDKMNAAVAMAKIINKTEIASATMFMV